MLKKNSYNFLSQISVGMTFEEWLLRNHGLTLQRFEVVALATGSPKDYKLAMKWYQNRYLDDLEKLNNMKQVTIKDYMEDKKNGNDK